jgi:nucleotide-binding universal stress UspA family protein
MFPEFQVEMIREQARKSGEHFLQEQERSFEAAGMGVELRLEFRVPREVICRIANDEEFQLVILGRRGLGKIRARHPVLFPLVQSRRRVKMKGR